MIIKKNFIYLIPDGGGNGGSGENSSTDPQSTQPARPKYFDQVAPDKRDSDDYKTLYGYQTLTDLADHTIATNKELAELKERSAKMIEVPDGKDPEKLSAFKKSLGIPEDINEYKMELVDDPNVSEELRIAVKTIAKDSLLSVSQAKSIDAMFAKIALMQGEKLKKEAENIKANYKTNLAASYTELTQDVDKNNAAERDLKEFESFLAESGLDKMFNDNALLRYNPTFIRGVAKYCKAHGGSSNTGSTLPGAKRTTQGLQYGKAFMDRYGR